MSLQQGALSEVEIKKEVGVLYDDEAKGAFESKAVVSEETKRVSWVEAEAYAAARGWIDSGRNESKRVLFKNLSQFQHAREGLDRIWEAEFVGVVMPRQPTLEDLIRRF